MSEFSARIPYMQASADVVRVLFESIGDPGTISFGGGAPAREALPVEELAELTHELLRVDARGYQMLQYSSPQGLTDLRQVLLDTLLAEKGLKGDIGNIIIGQGGMEGLSLSGNLYLDPGDVVLVESPTFVQALQTFQLFQAKCVACETDSDGFVIDSLEENIKKYNPKMIYCIPTFQNPSGRTTSLERRKALAELASKYDVILLEDDPYCELRYSGDVIPPIKFFDKTGHVIYANSFSKIFAPGFRLGYVFADKKIVDRLYDAKTAINSHTNIFGQVLCAEFFSRGMFAKHLERIRGIHKERRDATMEALKEFMPEGVSWNYPDGGLFTWLVVPEHLSTTELLPAAQAKGVTYLPGKEFFAEGQPMLDNCMRVSFGGNPPERIREGIRLLAELLKEKL